MRRFLSLLDPANWSPLFAGYASLFAAGLVGAGLATGTLLLIAGGLLLFVGVTITTRQRSASSGGRTGLSNAIRNARSGRGLRVVAIGGGTGMPAVLRALKPDTANITAIVTVADDGGSSGRLRRDLGVIPPGDLRNNIAALADDESLMTKLLQYRFENGELSGHAFGNLFITALAGVAGGLEAALVEIARVLNLRGRVFPATLADVKLVANIRQPSGRVLKVVGESIIPGIGGVIETVSLDPEDAPAYPDSVRAILEAQLVVIGPGSLFTSILPILMVSGVREALRATNAYKVYVCNVATQPGETDDFTVADHVMALERHIGRGVFQAVLANDAMPEKNAGPNTKYVTPSPPHHEIAQRYEIRYTDMTDETRPWRHDGVKLASALKEIVLVHRIGGGFV
jgi:uncharacterized cofD-like protein